MNPRSRLPSDVEITDPIQRGLRPEGLDLQTLHQLAVEITDPIQRGLRPFFRMLSLRVSQVEITDPIQRGLRLYGGLRLNLGDL